MDSVSGYLLLILAGLVAGVLNVVAGGGSFLTLPILIFMGLPPSVANGTNRLGIVAQDLAAVATFDKNRVLDRSAAIWAALPATAGAGLGAWLALGVSEQLFQRLLAVLMVVLSVASLWLPQLAGANDRELNRRARMMRTAGFFVVGIYGGFVQAGVGFLFLAVTSLLGLDLVRGNAVKVLSILPMTGLALAIFAANDRVEWATGGILAVGFFVGGLLGARLTVLKGHRWLQRVVTATILLFAVKLFLAR